MKPLSIKKQSIEHPVGVAAFAPPVFELRSSNPAEALTHDFDGNMKGGLAYDFVWDGEPRRLARAEMDSRRLPAGRASRGARASQNRLIEATPKNPAALDYRFFCTYDYLGRRVTKYTNIWWDGQWYPDMFVEEKMFYEGWNVVYRENDSWGAVNVEHYTWGLDLSGSLQGAGGVGGLLAVHHNPGYGNGSDYWYQFDGNGNVSELMDFTGGVYMHYEYDPFGRITNNSPTWRNGDWNPFTFSTKYMDRLQYNDLSQAPGTVFKEPLYYYGYRHYSPELGRWLSRDPIGESGGENLLGFVTNNPIVNFDVMGLSEEAGIGYMSSTIQDFEFEIANDEVNGFGISKAWKVKEAIRKLRKITRDANYSVKYPANQNSYSHLWKKIYLEDSAPIDSVLHETVHLYNHLEQNMKGPGSWNENEGMAYAMGASVNTYRRFLNVNRMFKEFSNSTDENSRERLFNAVQDEWRDGWAFLVKQQVIHKSDSRPISGSDYSRLAKHLEILPSCHKTVNLINASPVAKSLCLQMKCQKGGKQIFNATSQVNYISVEEDLFYEIE